MKKHLSRITAIVSAVFGLVFIILLICTAFGGLSSEDFDNKLVKILLFVFGGCYVAITVTAVALQFSDKVTVKEVQVSQSMGGNVKVTPAVIRGLIKKNVKALPGIKFRHMSLFLTEFGVQIGMTVSCSGGRRAQETGAFLQALVADVCKRELDLEFRTINVKVVGFKSVYTPDVAKIEAETQAMLGKQPEFPDEPADPEYYDVETPVADANVVNNAPEATEDIPAAPETPADEMPDTAETTDAAEAAETTENAEESAEETKSGEDTWDIPDVNEERQTDTEEETETEDTHEETDTDTDDKF